MTAVGTAELTTGRDFAVYAAGMDAGLALKLDDLRPAWAALPAGSLLLDIGTGTGALLAAVTAERPDLRLAGVEISPTLRAASQDLLGQRAQLYDARAGALPLADGSVDAVVFSSVLHEVYSYQGYDHAAVGLALAEAARVLRPGGRVAVRDGVAPDRGSQPIWLELTDPAQLPVFTRFLDGFRPDHEAPGIAAEPHPSRERLWRTSLHEAAEYLSKKDYLANLDSELHEEFGVHTLDGWADALRAAGFGAVKAGAYVHPWVRDQRYSGKVALYRDVDGAVGARLPWPATTVVLHARRTGCR